MSKLVIVESPAKAKTIEKYLGAGYKVMASYGHIRDLPPKNGSVDPDNGFAMLWEVGDRAKKNLGDIERAVKLADTLVLATDPDREGEAISWHVAEHLGEKKLLKGKHVERVTFNEITKNAVKEAFAKPRQVNQEMVDSYMARRALDYLVGFNLSPVLWHKLPGSRSAGRVQSVALRLICDREHEIEQFKPQEYWTIEILLKTEKGDEFTARLTEYNGKKLDKFAIPNQQMAQDIVKELLTKNYAVSNIDRKQVKRQPPPPFITSSLQIEASRKLGFGASRTMRTAQRLYEGVSIGGETTGLITYMRTDGVTLSQDAIDNARSVIKSRYGDNYLPGAPRIYTSKAKNAQEAHEAIRPTDLSRTPDDVARYVDSDEARLYEIIWQRTLACQMENALLDQVAIDIAAHDGKATFRANGSIVAFDGFMKAYAEGKEDDAEDDGSRRLPPIKDKEALKHGDVTPEQHFTQPPPRYSEATLVKRLEELGIGRPSTYASIIQVLQDRSYVVIDKKRFVPQDRGRVVTTFLTEFFPRYVEYDFTAQMENELDEISSGTVEWKKVLEQFWQGFSKTIQDVKPLTITNVIDALNEKLYEFLFPERNDGSDRRSCPSCKEGILSLKLGKFGAFVGCSNYPDCRYTRAFANDGSDDSAEGALLTNEPRLLGEDPVSGFIVSLRKGPYGPYVQMDPPEGYVTPQPPEQPIELGKNGKPKKPKKPVVAKPKRASLPKGMKENDVTLELALPLLALPRKLGLFIDTGEQVEANLGRFGPYVKAGATYASIPKDEDVLTIGLNRAIDLIVKKRENPPKNNFKRGGLKKKDPFDLKTGEVAAVKKTAAKKSPAKKAAPKKTAVKKTAVKKNTGKSAVKSPAAKKNSG